MPIELDARGYALTSTADCVPQIDTITVDTAVDSTNYEVTIESVLVTYTSGVGATTTSIAAGIAAAIAAAAVPNATVTASAALAVVTVTGRTAEPYTISESDANLTLANTQSATFPLTLADLNGLNTGTLERTPTLVNPVQLTPCRIGVGVQETSAPIAVGMSQYLLEYTVPSSDPLPAATNLPEHHDALRMGGWTASYTNNGGSGPYDLEYSTECYPCDFAAGSIELFKEICDGDLRRYRACGIKGVTSIVGEEGTVTVTVADAKATEYYEADVAGPVPTLDYGTPAIIAFKRFTYTLETVESVPKIYDGIVARFEINPNHEIVELMSAGGTDGVGEIWPSVGAPAQISLRLELQDGDFNLYDLRRNIATLRLRMEHIGPVSSSNQFDFKDGIYFQIRDLTRAPEGNATLMDVVGDCVWPETTPGSSDDAGQTPAPQITIRHRTLP